MPTVNDIAQRFRDLDFHDDTFVVMGVSPSMSRGAVIGSVLELRFSSHQSQSLRALQFIGCANLRVGMDFDVLAGNLPPNTSRVAAVAKASLGSWLWQDAITAQR